LTAALSELRPLIIDQKIDKVQQPEKDVLLLTLRGEKSARLLISAGTGDARIHMTRAAFENPASPPMFCMLLRKHLVGSRIAEITQPPGERVAILRLVGTDTLGNPTDKQLALELMGRNSNVILVAEDGRISDCMRRVNSDMSSKRQVLPGLYYRLPPARDKLSPLEASRDEIAAAIENAKREAYIADVLLDTFTALSPLICREIAFRAYGETDVTVGAAMQRDGARALVDALTSLSDDANAGRFTPTILLDPDGTPRDFSYTPITQYGASRTCETVGGFSELLERYFTRRATQERERQRASALTKTIKNARDRVSRRVETQREELRRTENREYLRECGDIITSNLHTMEKGMRTLRAVDYYSDDLSEREIALDPMKTPQQNAARYYKDYAKAKTAREHLTSLIASGETERTYLESVLEELTKASGERELAEIRRELTDTGYLKRAKSDGGKREKVQVSAPLRYVSSGGLTIRVGRNNAQNDLLTMKTSFKSDVWLHVQKRHGSHVVISTEGRDVDETTLREAAALAAWYSEARGDTRAAVDYCPVKNVKKPPGARPGMVLYTEFKTIIAAPDEGLVERLKRE
jgi:predicted ribosome quality control (RQC) complex YloA/Tae2 family protein